MSNLFDAINSIVDEMPSEFTTHQLILKLAQSNQHAYIRALNEHLDSSAPFQALHSKIGKHLSQANTLVEYQQDKTDQDIFGNLSSNALWKKAKVATSA